MTLLGEVQFSPKVFCLSSAFGRHTVSVASGWRERVDSLHVVSQLTHLSSVISDQYLSCSWSSAPYQQPCQDQPLEGPLAFKSVPRPHEKYRWASQENETSPYPVLSSGISHVSPERKKIKMFLFRLMSFLATSLPSTS